jgi:hypothetical protein
MVDDAFIFFINGVIAKFFLSSKNWTQALGAGVTTDFLTSGHNAAITSLGGTLQIVGCFTPWRMLAILFAPSFYPF